MSGKVYESAVYADHGYARVYRGGKWREYATHDANGRPLIYPGPDGSQHYMGQPVPMGACNCRALPALHQIGDHS